MNAGVCGAPRQERKIAGSFSAGREAGVLLAMQKVEGSNPFSRFGKDLHLQVFFVNAVGWCVCVAPDRNRTRANRPYIRLEEKSRLQGILDRSNR
jgi:hypothetical protein